MALRVMALAGFHCCRLRKPDPRPQIFCEISGEGAGQRQVEWGRTLSPFRNVGNKTVVLPEILLGQQSNFSSEARVVCKEVNLVDVTDIGRLLGRDWWFRLREPLLHVVLPLEYYQVWNCCSQSYQWDDVGFRAYCEDLSRYPSVPSNYRRERLSQFLLHAKVGKSWGMKNRRAFAYARRKLERSGLGHQRLLLL